MIWSEIVTKLEDELKKGSLATLEYNFNGQVKKFRSLKEVTDFYNFAKKMSAQEAPLSKRPFGRIQIGGRLE